MNGISLFFVAATLGVNAQVELGPNNLATYTIRIESVVIDQMRQGQEVRTTVALKDRQVRRFRIMVTPDGSPRKGSAPARGLNDIAARSESLVEYEPVLLENDEIEMWVQLAPERLETLASGKTIEGEVAANVPGIDRYRIFVGVGQLPRQQSPSSSDASAPFLLTDTNNALSPAGAEVAGANDPNARIGAPPLRGVQFQGNGNSASNTSGGAFGNSNRIADSRTTIRNGPDASTVSPPPLDRFGQPTAGTSAYPPQSTTPGFSANRDAFNNARTADSYVPPTYPDRNAPYAYGNTQPAAPLNYPQNPALQYPPQTTLAARPDTTAAVPPGSNVAWQPPAANPAAAAPAATTPAVQPSVPLTIKAEEPVRSTSTPLILTTLALFTSLGVNAYLGWLAWSFFWRYREAVNDSVRARSYNAPTRQAA